MATDDKETKTPKNDGEKTLDEKNLDELEGEELLKAAKSFKGRFEHEKKKRTEYEKEIDESKKEEEEEEEPEPEPETDSGTTHAEDPYEFAKELNALKGLDERQIDAVKTIAKAKGVSPSKARQTDEAKKLINAYAEEKKKEEKTPEPSTKQSEPQEPPMDTGKLKNALKSGDKNAMDKFLKDAGFDKFSEAYKD
jgi:hypothetical protein